eukprot:COSAG01_NODE_12509_length_1727_cov_2.090295_1_plen_140_part_00
MRVHYVAVPKELRARRVNNSTRKLPTVVQCPLRGLRVPVTTTSSGSEQPSPGGDAAAAAEAAAALYDVFGVVDHHGSADTLDTSSTAEPPKLWPDLDSPPPLPQRAGRRRPRAVAAHYVSKVLCRDGEWWVATGAPCNR